MRYLVISDIHANLEALDAVLAATPPHKYDRVLVLGDLVGYGADPNPVIDRGKYCYLDGRCCLFGTFDGPVPD